MKRQFFRKLLVFAFVLVMAAGVLPNISGVSAASKPKTPKITVAASEDGASLTVTIGKTKKADGYQIVAKLPGSEEFTEVKVLEENGKKKRTFTAENLPGGTYSVKVRGYKNSKGKKVWGKYSKVQTVTVAGKSNAAYSVGDIVTFGSYEQDGNKKNGKEPIEWRVLSTDGSKLFLLSQYAIAKREKINKYSNETVTWENCELRKWLNDTFMNAAFSDAEQNMIADTELKDVNTTDKVFLLSVDDYTNCDYGFSTDIDCRCAPTKASKIEKCKGKNYDGDELHLTREGEPSCFWWLRSCVDGRDYEFYVVSCGGGYLEDVYYFGDEVYSGHSDGYGESYYVEVFGVRPAIVVDINSDTVKYISNTGKSAVTEDSFKKNEEKQVKSVNEAGAGDIIAFGSYEQDLDEGNGKEPIQWIVLSKNDSEMLVLSRYGLDCQPYDYNVDEASTTSWRDSTIRKWLNEDFYEIAFDEAESSKIKKTKVKYNDKTDIKETDDKVFLLSCDEVLNPAYGFKEDFDDYDYIRLCAPTSYAVSKGVWRDYFNWSDDGKATCGWILRNVDERGWEVLYTRSDGYVYTDFGVSIEDQEGMAVRPAIVIKLK